MISAKLTGLDYNEILKYLGFRGQEIPNELRGQIRRCMDEVMKCCVPRLVYGIFSLKETEKGVFAGSLFLEGSDIKDLLKESDRAVLLAATAGSEISGHIAKVLVADKGSALIMDACASSAIENICDNFETELREEFKANDLYLTDRFSPGYGDLPLSLQKDFCAVLNTQRRIGLTVTDNFLMIPQKSVTAVMGISKKPQPERKSGCENCNMFERCAFRKEGTTCSGGNI